MRVNVTVSYLISLWVLIPAFVLFLSFLLFFPHLISLWLIVPVFFFFSLIFLFVPLPNLIVFFCVRVVFIFVCTLIFSHLISLWLIVPELSRSNILKASSISSSVTFKQSVTLNVVDSVYTKKSLQKEPSQLSSHNSHFSEQVQSAWMFCHFDYFCKNNLWLEKVTKIQSNQLKSIASSRTMLLEAILFDILRARSISWWVTWKKGNTAGIQMSFFDKRRKWQQNFSSDLLHQLLHHCRKIRMI